MSKETVYHGRQDDVQSVSILYEVTERDIKLNHGWKVLVGGLCIRAMLLECTNMVLSSRMENKDHPPDRLWDNCTVNPSETTLFMSMKLTNSTLSRETNDSRCAHTRDGCYLTLENSSEIDQPSKTLILRPGNTSPRVSDELLRQMKLLSDS